MSTTPYERMQSALDQMVKLKNMHLITPIEILEAAKLAVRPPEPEGDLEEIVIRIKGTSLLFIHNDYNEYGDWWEVGRQCSVTWDDIAQRCEAQRSEIEILRSTEARLADIAEHVVKLRNQAEYAARKCEASASSTGSGLATAGLHKAYADQLESLHRVIVGNNETRS